MYVLAASMCILFIYTDPDPQPGGYRLILANNRDEHYVRPAQTASLCPEKQIIAGKDMEPNREGGMWLGLSLKGFQNVKCRIAGLLNIPGEPFKDISKYRGAIVKDYLESEVHAAQYIEQLKSTGEYRPHNFVAVELEKDNTSVYHNCSIIEDGLSTFPGCQTLGFGNCTVETPILKVENGREAFGKIIQEFNDVTKKEQLIQEVENLLKWDKKHLPDAELERRNPIAYSYLSSIFVKILENDYGTRTHSIILVDSDWNVEFYENSMVEPIDPSNPTWSKNTIKAQL